MYISTYRDWRIHLQQIGFSPEKFSTRLNDPKRLFFCQATFAVEVILQECKVGFRSIMWRPELITRGWMEGRCLDI